MRNVVGQTPRGADFFPRNAIITKIYRRLESGENLFMAAPRRVGKTAIMRAMEDNPRPGFQFVYVITESIHDVEDYYHKLLTATLGSEALSKLGKKKEGIRSLVKEIAGSISIKLPWIELEINKDEGKSTYQAAFEKLLAQLDLGEDSIVIMVDEFPQTVENIREKHGDAAAKSFLRLNREQRLTSNSRIRFILTGSIGLPAVVKKLTSTSVINDLNVVEVPPLHETEATELATNLLGHYKVEYDGAVIPYLLEKIKWLIPFHIQLGVQELIDIFENKGAALVRTDVDKAFAQLLNVRNNSYFDHYYTRLKTAFPEKQADFALAVLNQAAQSGEIAEETIKSLAEDLIPKAEIDAVLESLVYDGYLFSDTPYQYYRFQSALLREWWNKKTPGQ